jgi:hypothetical protein
MEEGEEEAAAGGEGMVADRAVEQVGEDTVGLGQALEPAVEVEAMGVSLRQVEEGVDMVKHFE